MRVLRVSILLRICAVAFAMMLPLSSFSQDDSLAVLREDTIHADEIGTLIGQPVKPLKPHRDWTTWRPEAKRAMWMGIVFPGGGQIYNRKYWKLPFFYGGFVGCAYAWSWNNQMYSDYKQAYLDIVDDDENTHSYDQFLHLGMEITDANKSKYVDLFAKRKDRFRRYRDMSFFCILGVYALSIIDAYVDASLSEFDISDDLSLRIEPTYFNNSTTPLRPNGLGVQCSLNF